MTMNEFIEQLEHFKNDWRKVTHPLLDKQIAIIKKMDCVEARYRAYEVLYRAKNDVYWEKLDSIYAGLSGGRWTRRGKGGKQEHSSK